MKKNIGLKSIQFLLSLAMCAGMAAGHAQVSVSFDPAVVNMSVGETQLVALRVDGVSAAGISAHQFRLSFDPIALSLADPNDGFTDMVAPFAPLGGDALCTTVRGVASCEDPNWLLTSTGREAVTGVATVDNVGGEAVLMTGTTGVEATPAGSGVLAFFAVTAEQNGSASVDLSQSILADGALAPSSMSHTGGSASLVVNVGAIVDTDNDGLADSMDNCLAKANVDQRDTDGDGIGNACDPDVNSPNDCIVNFLDYIIYSNNFLTAGDLDTDNNGDGVTNFLDITLFASFFLNPPGPSGIANSCQ